jgi:hypothetical protein
MYFVLKNYIVVINIPNYIHIYFQIFSLFQNLKIWNFFRKYELPIVHPHKCPTRVRAFNNGDSYVVFVRENETYTCPSICLSSARLIQHAVTSQGRRRKRRPE